MLKVLVTQFNIDLFPNSLNGSSHFDEIFLLFKGRDISFLQRETPDDRRVSSEMIQLWTNFARKGEPCEEWEPFMEDNRRHLEIGSKGDSMKNSDIFDPIVQFWDKIWANNPPRMHLWRSSTWANMSHKIKVPKDLSLHDEL